ncbi:MAG: hypothetical protein P4M11_09470 [Candidatus Pacebacteria bacterium]|nr:hypothetical protein [Candidatus Paceibacterota bacterium]
MDRECSHKNKDTECATCHRLFCGACIVKHIPNMHGAKDFIYIPTAINQYVLETDALIAGKGGIQSDFETQNVKVKSEIVQLCESIQVAMEGLKRLKIQALRKAEEIKKCNERFEKEKEVILVGNNEIKKSSVKNHATMMQAKNLNKDGKEALDNCVNEVKKVREEIAALSAGLVEIIHLISKLEGKEILTNPASACDQTHDKEDSKKKPEAVPGKNSTFEHSISEKNPEPLKELKADKKMDDASTPKPCTFFYPSHIGPQEICVFDASSNQFPRRRLTGPRIPKFCSSIITGTTIYFVGGLDRIPSCDVYKAEAGPGSGDIEIVKCEVKLTKERGLLGLAGSRTAGKTVIYAVGGCSARRVIKGEDHSEYESVCERLDPDNNTCKRLANLSEEKQQVAVCELGRFLYAVGGYNANGCLGTVERLDTELEEGATWAPLLLETPKSQFWTPRSRCGICALDESSILIFGGFNGQKEIMESFMLTPGNDKMEAAKNMQEPGVFDCCKNAVLVCGKNQAIAVDSVKFRVHRYNTENGEWDLADEDKEKQSDDEADSVNSEGS